MTAARDTEAAPGVLEQMGRTGLPGLGDRP